MPWISRPAYSHGTIHARLPSRSRPPQKPASVASRRPSSLRCRCSPSISIVPEASSLQSSVHASKPPRMSFGHSLIALAKAHRLPSGHASSLHCAKHCQHARPATLQLVLVSRKAMKRFQCSRPDHPRLDNPSLMNLVEIFEDSGTVMLSCQPGCCRMPGGNVPVHRCGVMPEPPCTLCKAYYS